jgi:ubiquitin-conjugating enzyme E2 H
MNKLNKRLEKDISNIKKIASNVVVNYKTIQLDINGPKDSDYEGGTWRLQIIIPENYPYKSPSVGFLNKIYHPNIDLRSGSICLNTLNETWSPIYNLSHIYNIFIPQLLLYPNPDDPLNETAAQLYYDDPVVYKQNIKKYFVNKDKSKIN